METLEQKRNREMANILMVACLISMLRKWRVKQEEYEEWEGKIKKSKNPKRKKPPQHPLITSLMFMLGMEN